MDSQARVKYAEKMEDWSFGYLFKIDVEERLSEKLYILCIVFGKGVFEATARK